MASEHESVIGIKLIDKNGKKFEVQESFKNSKFSLSDAVVSNIMKQGELDDLKSCTLIVGANNIAIQIVEYSLTPSVDIRDFYNMPSNISILQAKNVGIHVVKQKIDLLQVDCESVFLGDCHVNQFDVGLNAHSEMLLGKTKTYPDCSSIDIRSSNIHSMQMFLDCRNLNIQRSNIDVLNMYGSMKKEAPAFVQEIHIWQYSLISHVTLQYNVAKLRLEESTMTNFIAKGGCQISQFENESGTVLNAYNFTKEHFDNISSEGWDVVAKSAAIRGLADKRAEAQYHVVQASYQREKGIKKYFGSLIDFCTGFGYKPMRALRACLLMIVFSWVLILGYDIASFHVYDIITARTIGDDMIIAITAIAGQSGLSVNDGFPYWVTFGEYIGAIVLFAMFVNALYVRYRD